MGQREATQVRIAIIGQAAFGEKALETLRGLGHQVVHVFAPENKPGAKPDPLAARALALGVAVSHPASYKDDSFQRFCLSPDLDLAVLAFVTRIVPEAVLHAPRQHSICFHPSLLPRHRGASAVNWAIIQGDAATGVTWFVPDKGIDTGPILVQREVRIDERDTVGSLYFGKLFPLGVETLGEAVELIQSGRAAPRPQDESAATYEPPCTDQHARIAFSRPAREIYNLVRGCDPQPGAWACLGNHALRLYGPALSSGEPRAKAGTVLSITEDGMTVALDSAVLAVARVRLGDQAAKVSPASLPAEAGLRVGARLT
ncbi:MAG: methionyl-tRNA formyltransferase [Deltaproteobacteria bacterium]|nr:methionyl-tRNA formyltransferase [Deltaproteobacteria bacterium]